MFTFTEIEKGYLPVRKTTLSAGWDCKARESIELEPNEAKLVKLGVSISSYQSDFTSLGYLELHLRSSLRLKGLDSGGVGIIDADYRDEICLIVKSSKFFKIEKGDRVAQLIPRLLINGSMGNAPTIEENRIGGFGSTK